MFTVYDFTYNNKGIEPCDACHRAKQTRIPFPLRDKKASHAFGLIHCDLWDRYHTTFLSGAYYFLTIVNDFTHSTWVYFLHDKLETKKNLVSFFAMVQSQFGIAVIMEQNSWALLVNFSLVNV